MLPCESTTTPSAALVPVAASSGSGMNATTLPSFALPMRMPRFHAPCAGLTRARLGVGDVEHVVLVDEDAARPAELRPLVDELAVLVEDLDAVVAAVADEQAALRVERERVRLVELARRRCRTCPNVLMQLAGLVELENPRRRARRCWRGLRTRRSRRSALVITSFGWKKYSGALPPPGLPSVSSTFPSG